jgi:hypothetical protein
MFAVEQLGISRRTAELALTEIFELSTEPGEA